MSRFVPNPALPAALGVMPELVAVMGVVAESTASIARQLAPVSSDETPGAYRDSIESHTEIDGGQGIGVVSAAGDPPEQAIYLEFGTSDTPTFAVLRRAAEQARV